MEEYLSGLSTPEVLERRERGEGGNAAEQITKTRSQIVRENLFTLFNFLNFLIAALLFAVGAYSNMLFIAIIILNIVIEIAQELKAKKLVDELSILNRPTVTVRRDGEEMTVGIEEIVKDDLVVLASGSQICNDAVVMSGVLEVNESLLTGESDAVVKEECCAGKRSCGFFRGGSAGNAPQGTGAADLGFSGERSYPAGEDEDPGAEYLLSGNPGACGHSLP